MLVMSGSWVPSGAYGWASSGGSSSVPRCVGITTSPSASKPTPPLDPGRVQLAVPSDSQRATTPPELIAAAPVALTARQLGKLGKSPLAQPLAHGALHSIVPAMSSLIRLVPVMA